MFYDGSVNNNLNISDLDVGMSIEGTSNIIAVVDQVNEVLNNDILGEPFQIMANEIQTGWQGVACEAFLGNYKKACSKALESLNAELGELKHNIGDLRENYVEQDIHMAFEMQNEFDGGGY